MNPISSLLKLPEVKKTSERSELLKFFIDNLKDKKGKQHKPARIGMLLSHLKLEDLYYFRSVCQDILNRSGEIAFNKFFWWSIKSK